MTVLWHAAIKMSRSDKRRMLNIAFLSLGRPVQTTSHSEHYGSVVPRMGCFFGKGQKSNPPTTDRLMFLNSVAEDFEQGVL